MTEDRTARIRALNDTLRQTFIGGRVLVTRGVRALPLAVNATILEGVRTFAAFTKDNDPHGEHDFGSLTVADHQIFWKIDCYDTSCTAGSDDPSDPAQTTRVLTIMLASEY